ncbi:MAG: PQQ-like beta-propeller repeat protein, partial [Planctomycetes bacterium]|nr:PQQ-like beta-propeller repeat protein [Planctomycetota bacterium]
MFAIVASTDAAEPVRQWQATPARPFVLRGTERRLLDRAERFLADEQWDDAIGALIRLLEQDNFRLIAVDDQRYISLTEYCHRLIAKLPVESLARYRNLVDATAKSVYRQGIENRDQAQLQQVIDKYFCSNWGDDALLALGELALQRGDYQTARNAWLQIGPPLGATDDRLIFPGTDVSLAAVAARLVLVAVREGDWERAERELAKLRENFPTATGRIGESEGVLVDLLASLLKQARRWPELVAPTDWRTFAANSQRTNASAAPAPKGLYELVWSQPIANEQLSVFPVVINDLVVFQDAISVRALRLNDGERVFTAQGDVFRSPVTSPEWQGQLRHTLTATDRYLFGVTMSPLGVRHKSEGDERNSVLWSLDLERDGAIAFHRPSEDASIGFVGAPVVKGTRLFVPIRSHEQTARAGIACYDTSTGERCWQRWLCQANTPATGWAHELATNLLTYDSGILYVNTNLGAVAAVRADDGQILWLRTYERQSANLDGGKGKFDSYRGPSPCVYHRGAVYLSPTDSKSLFTLDATSGEKLWQHETADGSLRVLSIQDQLQIQSSQGLQA